MGVFRLLKLVLSGHVRYVRIPGLLAFFHSKGVPSYPLQASFHARGFSRFPFQWPRGFHWLLSVTTSSTGIG